MNVLKQSVKLVIMVIVTCIETQFIHKRIHISSFSSIYLGKKNKKSHQHINT